MGKFIDLTGQKFGRLTVIERVENDKQNKSRWLCICECNNKTIVNASSLKNGNTKSCGCLARELSTLRNKKYNTYDLSGEYGIGYTANDDIFYFDLEDYDKIKDYCWHKHQDGYMRTCLETIQRKNKYILMHDLLINKENIDDEVDHINGRPYDNRKLNFRIVKHSKNMKNLKMYINNTSGCQGVYWNKLESKWIAAIQVDNKLIHLGTFIDKNQAITVRKQAEEKYFGEYNRAKEYKNK